MSQTVRVVTGAERLVGLAAAGVLGCSLLAAPWVSADAPSSVLRSAGVPSATAAPAVPPAAASLPATPTPPAPPPAPAPAVVAPAAPPPAPPAPPQEGCPVTPWNGGRPWTPPPLPAPKVADAALPDPLPPGKASSLAAISGKGIWVTNWPDTDLDVPALVARAKAAGLTSVWVRTGGSRQGWYGDRVLPELVPAAHAAGLRVIAWDFPFLSDPVADAARAKAALDLGIDGFAPDVETTGEGTYATPQRVALYLSLVRAHAGDRPIAATVPRPTPVRTRSFPYAAFAPYADVFVPMVYWSCNEPGRLVQESLDQLGRWLPVAPLGQAYDMGEEGGRKGVPSRAETWRFLDVAHRGGAPGAYLWTIEQVGAGQWDALATYPWDAPRR